MENSWIRPTHRGDLNRLQSFLDLVAKVSAATHGMVGPETWLQMAQQGGPALSSMSDEGLMSMAMVAQAMGGFRSGTAMTSLYQQMIGGKMTKYAAQELSGLGLVGKDYEVTKGGHIVWGKGALDTSFTQALQKDPLAATEILRKAFESHGFKTIEQQIPELFKMLGRQTTQRLIHDFLRNEPQMFGERGRMMKGEGVAGQLSIANATDYERNMHNLTAAWSDMMAKVGLPITIAAIPLMHKITEVFLKLGTLAIAHPDAIANIATGVTLLGAALMGGGGIAMLAALGPAGWLAAGIIAAGAAMALYKNPIMAWLESIRTTNWNEEITKALQPAIVAIKAWFLNLGTAIIEALKGMWEDMKGALGGLFHRTSFGGGGGGFGGGGLITNAAWSGGGGGVAGGGGYSGPGAPSGGSHLGGLVNVGGSAFHFGPGGGGSQHIPYGDYPITPGAIGAWGQAHGAIGLNNNAIWDSTLGRMRRGIEMHAGHNSTLFTAGCLAIAKGEWPQFKSKVQELMRMGGGANLHVGPGGASITPHRRGGGETHVHNNIYLDGKMIAKSTSKHFVRAAQYPTSVGQQDGRGTFMGPGAEVFA